MDTANVDNAKPECSRCVHGSVHISLSTGVFTRVSTGVFTVVSTLI